MEGGHLTCAYQDAHYALLHYTKGKSNLDLPHVRLFRSVVWDILENRPVSVTPPKSELGESLPPRVDDIVVMPFYDGVLIGQFLCKYTGHVVLHTRTFFGGGNTFYGRKTFGEMADEALSLHPPLPPLTPEWSRSFILQHPENRIVTPVSVPKMIHVYTSVYEASGRVTSQTPTQGALPYTVGATETRAQILTRYRSAFSLGPTVGPSWSGPALGPFDQGLVFYNCRTGQRYKIRTTEYNTVRHLRGNNASLDYTWLSLWQRGDLTSYLRVYPEERVAATALLDRWKMTSSETFQFYKDVFKTHSLFMQQVPPKYKPLLYDLHQYYKATLRPSGRSVQWEDCKRFMNERDIPQMLYILRWDRRVGTAATTATTVAATTGTAATAGTNPIVLATYASLVAEAAANVAASINEANGFAEAAEAEDDYSDMPGLVSLDTLSPEELATLLPPPPPSAAVERVESGPVM